MAHFAELDNNNVVTRVIVVGNDVETAAGPLGTNDMHVEGETWCIDFFKGGTWKQTSYNTNAGVHNSDGTALRKNYAGIGDTYDSTRDAFIEVKPFPSWTLNESTCQWDAPVAYPDDDIDYYWDESTTNWVEA